MLSFDQWKREVCRIAKKNKILYLVPGDNYLDMLFIKKLSPSDVVKLHCTNEAAEARHKRANRR